MSEESNRFGMTPEELRRAILSGKAEEVCQVGVKSEGGVITVFFNRSVAYVGLNADLAERLGNKLLEEAAKVRKAGS